MALSDAPSHELSELHALVERALRTAQARTVTATTKKERHRARSRHFLLALADALREHEGGDVEALYRDDPRARARFGANELLHDITVCRSKTIDDPDLWYITEVVWQVESELALGTREALCDFNKLVLGSAHHKLFVGALTDQPDALLRALEPAAARCTGRVFLALIPDPATWDAGPGLVRTWQFRR